tara:strand:- start:1983 stop:2930 length:948 start_codon:yes stop_codon:yes gene_type:complete
MAVNRITNKQVVNKESVNRANQVSTKNTTVRGNRQTTIVPGSNFSENYAITLKDIDTSILNHIKNVLKPRVREANETFKVPVMYGNEERWKAVRKRGVLRDKNGALILPLIMLKRVEVAKNTLSGQGFEHDVTGKFIGVVRNASWSKDNQYDRFSVQQGVKPVYENIVTGMPDYADITYEFVLWTNFIEQMNPLIETFVAQSNTYWGGGTDMKFLCNTDSITDASEMNQDGERFIKSTFNIIAKAYLLPEYLNSVITNKVSNMRKQLTPSKISFDTEIDLRSIPADSPSRNTIHKVKGPVKTKGKPKKESTPPLK